MIQVNVWLSTTQVLGKRIKNRFFGPLLASDARGENIGHASFFMELNERSQGYAKLADKSTPLSVQKSLSYVPQLVEGQSGKYYKRMPLKSLQVTHSFWPNHTLSRRQLAQDFFSFLHLAPKSKGVKPELSHHDTDMIRESMGDSTFPIEHPPYQDFRKKIDEEKRENLDKTVEIWNLDGDLDTKKNIDAQLARLTSKQEFLIISRDKLINTYQTKLDLLKKTRDELASNLSQNTSKVIFHAKKIRYLKRISNPDEKTFTEMMQAILELKELKKEQVQLRQKLPALESKIARIGKSYQKKMEKHQEEIKQTNNEISLLNIQLAQLDEKLKDIDESKIETLKAEVSKRADFLSRQENLLKDTNKTNGRHPDHIVSLPTSDSGLHYHINELAVIEAMEKEGNRNYSMIRNNCAKSVKRCLLAGIEHLRKELKANGVPNSFFKFEAIETTNGVHNWARTLERELIKLNMKHTANKTAMWVEVNPENTISYIPQIT